MSLGDFLVNSSIACKFTTVNTSGVPTQLAGTPVVSIYKGTSATQTTVGVNQTIDFDALTGLNHLSIDTSADAFYVAGAEYAIVITAGTVGGNSVVGYVVEQFSIENRSRPVLGRQIPTANYNTSSGLVSLGVVIPTASYNSNGGLVTLGTVLSTASIGGVNGLPMVGLQIPSAAYNTSSGLVSLGVVLPTASFNATGGLPILGTVIPTNAAGTTGGFALVGIQIPSASAGMTGGLPLTGTQVPSNAYSTTGGLAVIGIHLPTALTNTTGGVATVSDVRAQAIASLITDTYSEITSAVAATASLKDKLNWLTILSRNKLTQTTSKQNVYADNGTDVVATSSVSDDGTTFTKQRWGV